MLPSFLELLLPRFIGWDFSSLDLVLFSIERVRSRNMHQAATKIGHYTPLTFSSSWFIPCSDLLLLPSRVIINAPGLSKGNAAAEDSAAEASR